MAPTLGPPSSEIRTTTFVIPNLHCNSCVAQIERAIYSLQPPPFSISHSIVAHTVSVSHPATLDAAEVTKSLDEAGFDVYDERRFSRRISGAFDQAVQKWRSGSYDVDSRKRKRHMESCEECQQRFMDPEEADEKLVQYSSNRLRASSSGQRSRPDHEDLEEKPTQSIHLQGVAVTVPTNDRGRFEATVAIEGMTCASCTGAVTRALEDEGWVKSVNVNLLTHSATVIFEDESKKGDIVETVEDIGFGASLERVIPLSTAPEHTQPSSDQHVRANYAITGMTCSSCVSSITKTLEERPWITKVDVNLLSNCAKITLSSRGRAEEVVELIEDIGFEAKLVAIEDSQTAGSPQQPRSLMIRVDGMYCEHCPGKIVSVIEQLAGVDVQKHPSDKDPVMTVSYLPAAPHLTARTIIEAISGRDPVFKPYVYKPPSLEERSRQIYRREQLNILRRLLLCIISAIPTFIIGIVYMNLLPTQDAGRQYLMKPFSGVQRGNWAMFILATPVYFFAADVFHRRMLKEIRVLWRPRSPVPLLRRFYRFGSMNMLISFGTSIAYWASFAQLMAAVRDEGQASSDQQSQTYFDSVVFLTMFLLVGRLIEAHSKAKTGDAVTALGRMRPSTALLVAPRTQEVNADLIDNGDVIRVLPGTSPPCDGIVVAGQSRFDESALTGESKPIRKHEGEKIYSGTVNKDAAINIIVTNAAGQSMLDDVVTAIREGQTKRAPIERTADVLTGYFVPVITLLAIVVWITWLSLGISGALPRDYLDNDEGGWPFWALEFAIAVFVVACPCGLGLAAPTALFVGSGIAAQHGILVKGGGEAFQEASEIDIVAFDKTGTLTTGGEPKITDFCLESEDKAMTLALVAKLEQDSSHPVAKALVDHCNSELTDKIDIRSTEEIPGKGMRGIFGLNGPDNKVVEVIIGNEALMSDHSVLIMEAQRQRLEAWKRSGTSIALVATRNISLDTVSSPGTFTLAASFAAADPIRPESRQVISALQNCGIATWMITGDNQTTAEAVAAEVGIPPANVIAGVLPTQKSDKIKYLQQSQPRRVSRYSSRPKASTTANSRAKVAMLGDGINDAPALATADVGIALASGTDVAVQTAPFVILNPSSTESLNLTTVLTMFDLSRKVFKRVRFNFGWALVYNLVLLPIAAGVLYPIRQSDGSHVRLAPAWAALAMAASSVSVVLSSLSLRWSWLPGAGFRVERNGRRDSEVRHGSRAGVSGIQTTGKGSDNGASAGADAGAGAGADAPAIEPGIDRWGSQARRGRFIHDD